MPTAATKPPTVPPSIERLLLLPLIALPILWLAGYFFPPINHDVAAILDVSARWVNGERLYVEVIDENLPLTFVVHALPVLTSKILPGDPSFWFTAWVVAGIFASFWACRRLVKLVPSADHALTEALLPPVLLFLFTVLPNEHFGQREHIVFVASAPYMIASMARAEGILLGRGAVDRHRPVRRRGAGDEAALSRHPGRARALPAAPPRLARPRSATSSPGRSAWWRWRTSCRCTRSSTNTARSSCRWRSRPMHRSATPAGAAC